MKFTDEELELIMNALNDYLTEDGYEFAKVQYLTAKIEDRLKESGWL